ncbi:MAG: discoidin domain-containing protein, partial [Cytophagaceae bacterium]
MRTSFLVLSLMLAAGVSGAYAQQETTPNRNLAVGKKFVSSDPNTRDWEGGLTDGSWLPARGTTFATNDGDTFPKTVTLDLETVQTLGYVAVGVPSFGSTKTVSVSLSTDGATFSEVGRTTFPEAEEKKQVLDFKPASARYVRLTYLDYYEKKHNY